MNKTFCELMPPGLRAIILLLLREGISLLFVGGSVRSYLFKGELAHDLDAEWRPLERLSSAEWEQKVTRVKDLLRAEGLAPREAGVGVMKTSFEEWELEFSTPRTESYLEGRWDHSNFVAHFDSGLDFEMAFKRRDFTINAIGLLLQEGGAQQLIDPYQGVLDYERKILRPVSENFHRDPVRALRALRFELTLGFSHSEELKSELALANLKELSTYYFAHEARKVGELTYLRHFFRHNEHYRWVLPSFLERLQGLDWANLKVEASPDLLRRFTLLLEIGASEEELKLFATIFGHRHRQIKAALRNFNATK